MLYIAYYAYQIIKDYIFWRWAILSSKLGCDDNNCIHVFPQDILRVASSSWGTFVLRVIVLSFWRANIIFSFPTNLALPASAAYSLVLEYPINTIIPTNPSIVSKTITTRKYHNLPNQLLSFPLESALSNAKASTLAKKITNVFITHCSSVIVTISPFITWDISCAITPRISSSVICSSNAVDTATRLLFLEGHVANALGSFALYRNLWQCDMLWFCNLSNRFNKHAYFGILHILFAYHLHRICTLSDPFTHW